MNTRVTDGHDEELHVAVFVETGSLAMRDLREVVARIRREIVPSISDNADVQLAPRGFTISVAGQYQGTLEDSLRSLKSLKSSLGALDTSSQRTQSVDAQLLMSTLMTGHLETPLSEMELGQRPMTVLTHWGPDCTPSTVERLSADVEELQKCLGSAYTPVPVVPRAIPQDPPKRQWIHLPGRTGTVVRLYRELEPPTDRHEALSRSVANAIVGGLGDSALARLLREDLQLSYGPYSALIPQAVTQWLVVEADTTPGFESQLLKAIKTYLEDGVDQDITARRIKSAAQFMIRQRRAADSHPRLGLQLKLARYDGSDPWGVSNATIEELLELQTDTIRTVAHALFDYEKLSLIALSQMSEQDAPSF